MPIRIAPKFWLSRPWLGVYALVIGAVLIAILLLSLRPRGDDSLQVACGAHLRALGQQILLYANDHHGRYPDSLADLLKYAVDGDANPRGASEMFICPASNDIAADGAVTQAVADALEQPGHLSYIYAGSGLTNKTVTDQTVVMYEPLSHHHNGINVLFGDGSVAFTPEPQASQIINTVQNQKSPPATSGT
jgi:prepilin-type processing-associated H-X9-DG protein